MTSRQDSWSAMRLKNEPFDVEDFTLNHDSPLEDFEEETHEKQYSSPQAIKSDSQTKVKIIGFCTEGRSSVKNRETDRDRDWWPTHDFPRSVLGRVPRNFSSHGRAVLCYSASRSSTRGSLCTLHSRVLVLAATLHRAQSVDSWELRGREQQAVAESGRKSRRAKSREQTNNQQRKIQESRQCFTQGSICILYLILLQ